MIDSLNLHDLETTGGDRRGADAHRADQQVVDQRDASTRGVERAAPRAMAGPPNGMLGMLGRFRITFAAVVVAGVLLGLGVGYLTPVTYTAQGQMIAGATSVNAAAVPSFTQAGQSLAQTYSRVYTGDQVQNQLIKEGFDPIGETTTASPIASSSILLIESTADSKARALKLTDDGIASLTTVVSGLLNNTASVTTAGDQLRIAYTAQAKAQAAVDVLVKKNVSTTADRYQSATAALGSAQAAVSAARQLLVTQVANSVQSNGVHGLTSAHITSSTSVQRLEFWGAIGLVLGLVAWTLLSMARVQLLRRRMLRR